MTRVLVFGTFDGLHKGHEFFLEQAMGMADELVVAVARDEHVMALKKKVPKLTQQQRLESVSKYPGIHETLLCDSDLGSFKIIDLVKPDVIVLGHDQDALRSAIEKWLAERNLQTRIIRAKKKETTEEVSNIFHET